MKKLVLSTIIAATMFSGFANAEYTINIPLKIDQGGYLPNNSIVFVDGSSNPIDTEVPDAETPIEPVDKAKECDDKVTAAVGLLSSSYPEVNYVSHSFGFIPSFGRKDCQIEIELPVSKSHFCTPNHGYPYQNAVIGYIISLGIESVSFKYYGSCD